MLLTLKYFFEPKVTLNYPFEKVGVERETDRERKEPPRLRNALSM